MGADLDDPRLNELVGELSLGSERFRQLWAKQDVHNKESGTSRMHHPVVGPLELRTEKFVVTGADRQLMIIYHADPDTRTYKALQELTILAHHDVHAPENAR
ncbi:MAG: transcriptional regulator [Frankiales bacterium]|nr:transcriptional regulator [Frankiales bacterium]